MVDVSATGKLQPTNQVDVGSELSGIVAKVLVDDNDQGKKGQLLTILDLSKLEDAVVRSRANQDAALLILENEGVSVSSCIWLQGEDLQCPLPAITRAARLDSCASHDSLSLLHRLATTDVAGFD